MTKKISKKKSEKDFKEFKAAIINGGTLEQETYFKDVCKVEKWQSFRKAQTGRFIEEPKFNELIVHSVESVKIANTDINNSVFEHVRDADGKRSANYVVGMGLMYHYTTEDERVDKKDKALKLLAKAFIEAVYKKTIAYACMTPCFSAQFDDIDDDWNILPSNNLNQIVKPVGQIKNREAVMIYPVAGDSYNHSINRLNKSIGGFHKIFFDIDDEPESMEDRIAKNDLIITDYKNGEIDIRCGVVLKIGSAMRKERLDLSVKGVADSIAGLIVKSGKSEFRRDSEIVNKIMWLNRSLNRAIKDGELTRPDPYTGVVRRMSVYGSKKSIKVDNNW